MALEGELISAFTWVEGHANIWPWFTDAALFASIVEALAEPARGERITKVVVVEARAFVLAGAVARELHVGVVPIRKPGAIFPGPLLSRSTSADYRGRTDDLLLREEALSGSDRVLLVDDWLEPGSQALAAIELIRAAGAHVAGVAVIVDGSDPSTSAPVPSFHALIRAEALGSSG